MGAKIGRQVEDRLYLETENRCGICGQRDSLALTIHHIDHNGAEPNNSYENLIVLCYNCHSIYHQNKGISKDEIVAVKRRLILKTLTPFGITALKIVSRKKIVVGAPFTLLHLVELGLLEQGKEISFQSDDEGNKVSMEAIFKITSKGDAFLKKWVQ